MAGRPGINGVTQYLHSIHGPISHIARAAIVDVAKLPGFLPQNQQKRG